MSFQNYTERPLWNGGTQFRTDTSDWNGGTQFRTDTPDWNGGTQFRTELPFSKKGNWNGEPIFNHVAGGKSIIVPHGLDKFTKTQSQFNHVAKG